MSNVLRVPRKTDIHSLKKNSVLNSLLSPVAPVHHRYSLDAH